MKLIVVSVAAAILACLAEGQLHAHGTRHHGRAVAKREPDPVSVPIYVPGPIETVIVYELNGMHISEDEVRKGIANGTLIWAEDGNLSTAPAEIAPPTPAPEAAPKPTLERVPEHAPEPSPAQPPVIEQPSPVAVAPSSAPKLEPSQAAPSSKPEPSKAPPPQQPKHDGECEDCDKQFPDGELNCDQFPTDYGATPNTYLGLGGWIGVQDPGFVGAASAVDRFDKVVTARPGSCEDGSCCKPGAYCSYSCPPGYLKTSWAKGFGVGSKVTVGGLYCNDFNKLEMADGSIAKTLCVQGTDEVTVRVENRLSESVSICRTDYPGTEGETIATTTGPGETLPLACLDRNKYFQARKDITANSGVEPTSGQYYVNKKGVAEKDACVWGDRSKPQGNWAPLNLGASYNPDEGKVYISLFQNFPTTMEKLDFAVEIVSDDIDGGMKLKYFPDRNQYCSGADYSNCNRIKGHTIAANRGAIVTVLLTDH
ncbi:glycoside hydrolase family 132 protein [Zopfia rhizophila CBS 207.26]|uniref:Glycoside hydrolase family 132 protein n=1 Tax=Zopfia rhizophila CBS 207.26 TaxID=1314779 RepID=A0A6A6DU98_9PEZI|nr:glycoside hydrolase family 132 protein [Zopfia rhizophila CBS 207.26]